MVAFNKETQIAVWASGPTQIYGDRLFLVLDVATGTLSTRIGRDRFDQTSGRVISTSEDMDLATSLELSEPKLFVEELEARLCTLLGCDQDRD